MTQATAFQADFAQRRYDLDWLRIAAFFVLILYHVGMYYVTWDFHVKSPNASATIQPLMMLTSPWRMSLLFLVSGVATGYLLHRQGPAGFLGRRSVRLLVPLVFGMLVIVPPQAYFEVVEQIRYAGSYGEFWAQYLEARPFCLGDDCLEVPTWNHLWFVAYLWVYTVILYAAVRLVPRCVDWLRRGAERGLGMIGIVLVPIAYFAAIRLAGLHVRFPSTHALFDDWYNHALYAPVFVLGFALAGTRTVWVAAEQWRWHALGIAVVGWAFLITYGIYANEAPRWLLMAQRAVYAAQQWLPIVAALGFACRHLNRDGPARRYLTTAIFPVYILHQTVIIVVAHTLQPAALDPVVEGVLLALVTVAACFLGYELIRRVPPLRPLFGLALGRRERAPPLTPQPAS